MPRLLSNDLNVEDDMAEPKKIIMEKEAVFYNECVMRSPKGRIVSIQGKRVPERLLDGFTFCDKQGNQVQTQMKDGRIYPMEAGAEGPIERLTEPKIEPKAAPSTEKKSGKKKSDTGVNDAGQFNT